MKVAVLSSSLDRSRFLRQRVESLQDEERTWRIDILSTKQSAPGRGQRYEAIFVDHESWPLSEDLVDTLTPCLWQDGGGFLVLEEPGR